MTLILKLDLDMVKMYLYTEDEVPNYSSSKVIAWTDRQTDRQTHTQTDRQTDTHTDRHTDLSEIITLPPADGNNKHNWVYRWDDGQLEPQWDISDFSNVKFDKKSYTKNNHYGGEYFAQYFVVSKNQEFHPRIFISFRQFAHDVELFVKMKHLHIYYLLHINNLLCFQ